MYKKIITTTVSLTLASFLIGCGSSGSDDSSSSTTTQVTSTTTGIVSDGYVKEATIYVDRNNNHIADNDENTTTTDENGSYTISEDDLNYDIISVGGIDTATNKIVEINLTKPAGDETTISPITTMIASLIQDGLSDANAKSRTAEILGINEDKLYVDPVKDIEVTKAVTKLVATLKLAEIDFKDLSQKINSSSSIDLATIVNNDAVTSMITQIDEANITDPVKLEQTVSVVIDANQTDANLSMVADLINTDDVTQLDDVVSQLSQENNVSDINNTDIVNTISDVKILTNDYFIATINYNGLDDANLSIDLPKGTYKVYAESLTGDSTSQIEIDSSSINQMSDTEVIDTNSRTSSTSPANITIINNSDNNQTYTFSVRAYDGLSDNPKTQQIWVIVEGENINYQTRFSKVLDNNLSEQAQILTPNGMNVWSIDVNNTGTYDVNIRGDINNNPLENIYVQIKDGDKLIEDATTTEGNIAINNVSLEANKTYTIIVQNYGGDLSSSSNDLLGSYILDMEKQ